MTLIVAPSARAGRSGGARQALVAVAQVRLMILALLFGAGVLLIVGRLAVLAFAAPPPPVADPNAGLPVRGDIVDRNGQPLARSIDGWSIALHPQQVIGDKAVLAQRLAELFPGRTAGQYFAMLHSNAKFAWLKRRALPETVKAANALGEPGIELLREPDRLYPQSAMAAHVLGYLDATGHGAAGMEKMLDARLSDPATRGTPVALSIDARVQAALDGELGTAMADLQARGAAGIVLDVRTGEIIAMTSLPSFNPNALDSAPPRNNVTQSVYELGSTFKPLAVAEAIDSGTITSMARKFDATKPMPIGRFTVHDDPGDEQFRWLNIPETLIYSSNIATARIADELGAARMQDMFRRLGFDQRPGTELEGGGAKPLWPGYWGRITVMTTAYGHGIAVTPLHLASAYAALVNGGIWRPATLLKLDPGKAPAGRRVIQEATSARMRQLLRLIVLRGTGRNGEAQGYRVAGKTGTAEAAASGGYDKSRNVSTFAAAFPIDAPRYVVVAMLDSPHANAHVPRTTAAWTAAPVVRAVIARTGPFLGVLPDANRDIDVSELLPLVGATPGKAEGNDR